MVKSKHKESIIVDHRPECIFDIERFIESVPDIGANKRNRLLIVATEIFDNILQHTVGHAGKIHVRIYKTEPVTLIFRFKSSNFEIFISNIRNNHPYYDKDMRRYRGMGVQMCYNLSRSIHYRVTPDYNAISISI